MASRVVSSRLGEIHAGVSIELKVASMRDSGIAAVDTVVTNQKGETCVKGVAMIMAPDAV